MRVLAALLLGGVLSVHAQPQGAVPPLERAREASADLLATLKGTLLLHLERGGPEAAFTVCADTAQVLTEAVAHRHGLMLHRVSTRWRNPLDEPDAYEADVLRRFSLLLEDGQLNDSTEHVAVVTEEGTRVFRYLRPIRIQRPCLSCHGQKLAPGLQTMLREYYPDDRATGYTEGALRGAVSVRFELD